MNSCLSLCSAFLTSHSSDPFHTSWADGWGFKELDQWLLHVSCSKQLEGEQDRRMHGSLRK